MAMEYATHRIIHRAQNRPLIIIALLLAFTVSMCACNGKAALQNELIEACFSKLYDISAGELSEFSPGSEAKPEDIKAWQANMQAKLSERFAGFFTEQGYDRFMRNSDWRILYDLAEHGGEITLGDLNVSPRDSDEAGDTYLVEALVTYTNGDVKTSSPLIAEVQTVNEEGVPKIDSLFFRSKPVLF